MQSPAETEEQRKKRKQQEHAFSVANSPDLAQTSLPATEKQIHANCEAEETTMTAIITQPTDSCKIDNSKSISIVGETDSGIASTSSGASHTARLPIQPEYSTDTFAGATVAETTNLYSAGSSKQVTNYGCADCSCCAIANEPDIMELCAHLCFCIACFEACGCADCSGCADCNCSGCS